MSKAQETLADIAAKLRSCPCDDGCEMITHREAHNLADRIEAAAKREKAEIEANALAVGGVVEAAASRKRATPDKYSAVGDAAAMREALEYLLKERDILDFCHNNLGSKTWEDWDKVYNVLRKIIEKAMRALAARPRNCDVGTAEEQDKRFTYQFCRVGIEGCIRCKLNTLKHRGNTCSKSKAHHATPAALAFSDPTF